MVAGNLVFFVFKPRKIFVRNDINLLVESWKHAGNCFCGDAIGSGKYLVSRTTEDFVSEIASVDEQIVLRPKIIDDGGGTGKGFLHNGQFLSNKGSISLFNSARPSKDVLNEGCPACKGCEGKYDSAMIVDGSVLERLKHLLRHFLIPPNDVGFEAFCDLRVRLIGSVVAELDGTAAPCALDGG